MEFTKCKEGRCFLVKVSKITSFLSPAVSSELKEATLVLITPEGNVCLQYEDDQKWYEKSNTPEIVELLPYGWPQRRRVNFQNPPEGWNSKPNGYTGMAGRD